MEKGSKCKLVEMMREQMKGFCVSKAGKKLIDALCEKLRGFNVKVVEVKDINSLAYNRYFS